MWRRGMGVSRQKTDYLYIKRDAADSGEVRKKKREAKIPGPSVQENKSATKEEE